MNGLDRVFDGILFCEIEMMMMMMVFGNQICVRIERKRRGPMRIGASIFSLFFFASFVSSPCFYL